MADDNISGMATKMMVPAAPSPPISPFWDTDNCDRELHLFSQSKVMGVRQAFVTECLNDIDLQFGRVLGCRMHPTLRLYVDPENHQKRKTFLRLSREKGVLSPSANSMKSSSDSGSV